MPEDHITVDGAGYYRRETLEEWYPDIVPHMAHFPIETVAAAFSLRMRWQDDACYIENGDRVVNFYTNFNHEGTDYDMFLVPTPDDWALIREHCPPDMPIDRLIGRLESVLKYDVHSRHIAPLADIRAATEQA